jgi:hypothetical protein
VRGIGNYLMRREASFAPHFASKLLAGNELCDIYLSHHLQKMHLILLRFWLCGPHLTTG